MESLLARRRRKYGIACCTASVVFSGLRLTNGVNDLVVPNYQGLFSLSSCVLADTFALPAHIIHAIVLKP